MKKIASSLVLSTLLSYQALACPGAGMVSLSANLGSGSVELGVLDSYDATVKPNKGFSVATIAAQFLPLSGTPMDNICANRGGIPSCTLLKKTREGAVQIPTEYRRKYGVVYVIFSQDKYKGNEIDSVTNEVAFTFGPVNLEEGQARSREIGSCGDTVTGTLPYKK